MTIRYKKPDSKNAISIVQAAKEEIDYTFSIEINEKSSSTIIRNIYESFTQAKKKSVGSSDVCSSATNCNACHTLSNTHPNGHDCFWCKTNSRCVDLDNYPDNYPTDNNCSLGC